MVTTLTGLYPGNTYKQLLQIGSSNIGITGSLQTVGDGEGNECPLQLSLTQVKINDTALTINNQTITLTGSTSISGTHTGTSSGTNTGDQTITLSGDVSGSGTGSITTTIGSNTITTAMMQDNSITYSKLQNITAERLIGNATGVSANFSEILLGSTLEFTSGTTLATKALSGDISTSANSFVTSIGNNKITVDMLQSDSVTTAKILNANVTYDKIQNVTNNTILGNTSGSAAAPSEISLPLSVANGGSGRASTTAYAVICGGTTSTGAEQSIASVGTSGHVLTSNGAGALPTFQAPASAISAATQAEQETGSSTSVYVSPGRQQYHASAAKAWILGNNSSTIFDSYNVSSITDIGIGSVSISFSVGFSNVNYARVGCLFGAGGSVTSEPTIIGTTASIQYTRDTSFNLDDGAFAWCYFGDQ